MEDQLIEVYYNPDTNVAFTGIDKVYKALKHKYPKVTYKFVKTGCQKKERISYINQYVINFLDKKFSYIKLTNSGCVT